MAGRIVLLGATGYTGRLTAAALVRRGAGPVLAGRSADRLARLADELAGHSPSGAVGTTAVVDATDEAAVRRLLEPGDVLVSTVGPFLTLGLPAARAATDAGVAYLDSTGEPPFVRRVFEQLGPRAERTGARLVTAFGYDYVPGNLAAGLALGAAGAAAARVDVGYFVTGASGAGGAEGRAYSSGTAASAAGIALEPSYAWRGGRLTTERTAARTRSFVAAGRERPAVSVGGSEHFALPRLHPGLRDVGVYLGWAGGLSRALAIGSAVTAAASALPGVRRGLGALADRLVAARGQGTAGGPDARERAAVRSLVVAEALAGDGAGEPLARVVLAGANPYELTAELLAFGATSARDGAIPGAGALGPVEAFGLDRVERTCAEAGLRTL